jgi:hypothetical protein
MVIGILLGAGFFWLLGDYKALTGTEFQFSTFWIAVVACWWYFSALVVVGLGLRVGRWPQVAVLPAVLALGLIDLVAYGHVWDAPLAWGIYLFTQFSSASSRSHSSSLPCLRCLGESSEECPSWWGW